MRQLGRRVETRAPAIARATALVVDQVIVSSTPVDTGVARSNWQANIGGPVTQEREAHVPGEGGSTVAANTQAAIEDAEAVINTFEGDGEIYLSNPLPYIESLNNGSSAQAPAGFVESAIQAGVAAVRGAKLLT